MNWTTRAPSRNKQLKVPRGTRRASLRARWAVIREKHTVMSHRYGVDTHGNLVVEQVEREGWKPTFSEWRKLNVKEG